MQAHRTSRRVILKHSLTGLFLATPLGQVMMSRPVFAATCDTCTWEWQSQECVGGDLYDNWICVDPVFTDIICQTQQDVYPSHPDCREEDTEIESAANGLLWAAELGYTGGSYGMLRARTSPGAAAGWEQFQLAHLSGDNPDSTNPSSLTYAIQSLSNGLYVSAELGYSGGAYAMLRARASVVGPWEQFRLVPMGGELYALQSLGNGLLVAAELGYSGGDYAMLRARTSPSAIGGWERHWIF